MGAGRLRTCENHIQHQQLTSGNPQIDPQSPGIQDQQLAQLVNLWPNLPAGLKTAILTIADRVGGE
jgi:hypothetical protein